MKLLSQRRMPIRILGTIPACSEMNMFIRKHKATKKRKIPESSKTNAQTLSKGTKAEHCRNFIFSIMCDLDRHNMQGMYLVMDNTSINHAGKLEKYFKVEDTYAYTFFLTLSF